MYSLTLKIYHHQHYQQQQQQQQFSKYHSHTYTINEITCKFIQFLSIYIQNYDILIEIFLNIYLVVTVNSSKISIILEGKLQQVMKLYRRFDEKFEFFDVQISKRHCHFNSYFLISK
jgi:hypothetical protein